MRLCDSVNADVFRKLKTRKSVHWNNSCRASCVDNFQLSSCLRAVAPLAWLAIPLCTVSFLVMDYGDIHFSEHFITRQFCFNYTLNMNQMVSWIPEA